MVFRPLIELGNKTMGYLPGEVAEKISPHYGAVKHLVEFIKGQAAADTMDEEGIVKFVPPNFIRGDTLHNTFMIVDDAQNFEYGELKTIATRMGPGCKIVVTGDPFQCDLPYNNDERDNAISLYTYNMSRIPEGIEREKFCFVLLHEVERSLEAKIHAKYL